MHGDGGKMTKADREAELAREEAEMEHEFLSAKEIAKLLRVDDETIKNLAKAGKIKFIKIGNQFRFHREELERLLAEGTSD